MSEQAKCCGTCKYWRRLQVEPNKGACICPCELPPRQPSSVYLAITRSSTRESDGTTCPTHERREGE